MAKKKSVKKQKTSTAKKKLTKKKPEKKKASKKKKAPRKKPVETEPLEDMKHAGDLMLQAVELVMNAGAKEAKQLVNMAADMVKKIRD